jgi:hypothetical protein
LSRFQEGSAKLKLLDQYPGRSKPYFAAVAVAIAIDIEEDIADIRVAASKPRVDSSWGLRRETEFSCRLPFGFTSKHSN